MVSSSEDSDEAGNLEVVVALSLSLATCSFDNGMSFFYFYFCKNRERESTEREGKLDSVALKEKLPFHLVTII